MKASSIFLSSVLFALHFAAASVAGLSCKIPSLHQRAASPTVNLSAAAAAALAYEESNYVNGRVAQDPFYNSLPPSCETAAPGTLLKLEETSNTTLFTLPPTSALSRFIYQSKSLNGRLVRVSAYILWPYMPRRVRGKLPIVLGHMALLASGMIARRLISETCGSTS